MTTSHSPRVDKLLEVLLDSLDDASSGSSLSGRAHLSRHHAIRAFRARTGETPEAFRRRLRLERAAHELRATSRSVLDVAQEAGYESAEAFTRAFRAAYGRTPSLFRRDGLATYLLSAPSGIHYRPRRADLPPEDFMDILDHLLDFDDTFTRRVLDRAATLPEAALDTPLGTHQPLSFESPDHTLRDVLDKLVFTKEVWVAAVRGLDFPDAKDRSVAGLKRRMNAAYPAFRAIAREVQAEAKWQESFVDALCEPAERFAYGGMLAHVLTVDASRRALVEQWLRQLGVTDVSADPMHHAPTATRER